MIEIRSCSLYDYSHEEQIEYMTEDKNMTNGYMMCPYQLSNHVGWLHTTMWMTRFEIKIRDRQ